MNKTPSSRYEIRVQGHLAPRRLSCFGSLTITHHPTGVTVILGTVRDQAALYGLLNQLSNLGVTLLSVNRVTGSDETQES